MADDQNCEVDQGATWRGQLDWTDESEVAVDLTGYSARMQVRRRVTDTSALLELTTTNGRITLYTGSLPGGSDPYNILLEVDADVMEDLPATPQDRRWFYDLEMVNGSEVTRLLQGRFIVNPEVTR